MKEHSGLVLLVRQHKMPEKCCLTLKEMIKVKFDYRSEALAILHNKGSTNETDVVVIVVIVVMREYMLRINDQDSPSNN